MKPLLALLLLLALAGAAHAESLGQVVAALRANPVYQSPGIDLLDSAGLQPTLSGTKPTLYVAVLPAAAAASAADARQRAIAIGGALRDANSVVLVITANRHLGIAEGSGAGARGVDATKALADQFASRRRQPFDKAHLTVFVQELKGRLDRQVASAASRSGGSHGTASTIVLIALIALCAAGLLAYTWSARRRRAQQEEGLHADDSGGGGDR